MKTLDLLIDQLTKINIFTCKDKINTQANHLLQTKYPQVLNTVLSETSFLPKLTNLRERLFCIKHKIQKIPICVECSASVKFNTQTGKFNDFCSQECAHHSPIFTKRREQTMVDRYGVANVCNILEYQNKRKQTMVDRYGVEFPIQNHEIKNKICKTLTERYGTTNVASIDFVKTKRRNTNVEKFGNSTFAGRMISPEIQQLLDNKNWLIHQHHTLCKSLTDIARELSLTVTTISRYFNKHNIEVKFFQQKILYSQAEQEIIDFLKNDCNIQNVIQHNRKLISPHEIDIFLPDFNIAIELNGIYWHSELVGNKDRKYHNNKTIKCKEHGIQLLHIWDIEWNENKQVVKSRLQNLLKLSTRVYARKCKIIIPTNQQETIFFNETHLQKTVQSTIKYALSFNDKIVAMMSFNQSRYSKKIQWELLRFSCKSGLSVVGGASKLFQHFIKMHNPVSVISYCDRRWSIGKLYPRLGFKYLHTSSPNYFYIHIGGNTSRLHSRIEFQKHKLKNKLEIFDPNLTEWQNMQHNGYDRIWDCGNEVFIWNNCSPE